MNDEKLKQIITEHLTDINLMQTGDPLDCFPELQEKLFQYYCFDAAIMPYEIAKAKTGDPINWMTEQVLKDLNRLI